MQSLFTIPICGFESAFDFNECDETTSRAKHFAVLEKVKHDLERHYYSTAMKIPEIFT
jgi:hypothetical protein